MAEEESTTGNSDAARGTTFDNGASNGAINLAKKTGVNVRQSQKKVGD